MEFNFHGFHRTTSGVQRIYLRTRSCRPIVKARDLHPDAGHDYLVGLSETFRYACLFQARGSVSRNIRPGAGIRFPLFPVPQKSAS